jgi:5-methylcytosine-specific restriction endonuclease McrA
MKGLPWGEFYNKYKDKEIIPSVYEERISKLMEDDDVTNNRGIYAFVLSNDERHLNLRAFSQSQKRQAYERQKRKCVKCEIEFQIEEMEGDHIKLWSEGGKTIPENCQMLCIGCHREKSRR